MKSLDHLIFAGVAVILVTTGCAAETGTDRALTENERGILDRLAEPSKDDTTPEETEAARHEFMSRCMADEGLEYLGPPESESMIEWLGLSAAEFRAEYGFGHSTTIGHAMAYQDFVDSDAEEYGAAFGSLSETEREDYRSAEPECLQRSYAAFGFPETGSVRLPEDSPINEYFVEAASAAENDARVVRTTVEWADCMREEGYDFGDRDEMGVPLQQEAELFMTAFATEGQALVDAGGSWSELSPEDVLDPGEWAELQDLQEREMAVAAADQRCIDQGHDIDATFSQAYDEYLAEVAGESA